MNHINIHIPEYPLTEAGREIAELCELTENDEYFIAFGKQLQKQLLNRKCADLLHIYKIANQEEIPKDKMPDLEKVGDKEFLITDNSVDYIKE